MNEERNMSHTLEDEALGQVSGGGPGSPDYGSDGNVYDSTDRLTVGCGHYRCKHCGHSCGDHAAGCCAAEDERDRCGSCTHFELTGSTAEGSGCCRRPW